MATRRWKLCRWSYLLALLALLPGRVVGADDPVALRLESLPLVPAHLPTIAARVKNLGDRSCKAELRITAPQGWQVDPARQTVNIPPQETIGVTFQTRRGITSPENQYPIEIVAAVDGREVAHRQQVVCTSAPYFKPEVDGKCDDWKDAVPVTFLTQGKRTEVRTYWNRRDFAVLVAVDEDRLVPWQPEKPAAPCDAVQLSIAAKAAPLPGSPKDPANRAEFLLVQSAGAGRCFHLAQTQTPLESFSAGPLQPLPNDEIKVAVTRDGTTTRYECSIPFRMLGKIRPGEGREFCFSLLVHDPDGTGLRDWGEAAGLWPWERSDRAWSKWPGAVWPEKPPQDSRTPWGMCSSKY